MLLGGGKQGNEVTCRPRSQGKQLNRAECKFHTTPLLILREGYPPTSIHPKGPSLHLDVRKVVVVVDVLKQLKKTTSSSHWDTREVVAEVLMERLKKTTSDSRLDVREVVVVAEGLKQPKKATSGSRLDAREVEVGWWQGGMCGRCHIQIALLGLDSPCHRHHRCCGLSSLLRLVVAAL